MAFDTTQLFGSDKNVSKPRAPVPITIWNIGLNHTIRACATRRCTSAIGIPSLSVNGYVAIDDNIRWTFSRWAAPISCSLASVDQALHGSQFQVLQEEVIVARSVNELEQHVTTHQVGSWIILLSTSTNPAVRIILANLSGTRRSFNPSML